MPTCLDVLVNKVDFHGLSLLIKGMLTGGVEVPLNQLQIPPSNLSSVAFCNIDLRQETCDCQSMRHLPTLVVRTGSLGTRTMESQIALLALKLAQPVEQ